MSAVEALILYGGQPGVWPAASSVSPSFCTTDSQVCDLQGPVSGLHSVRRTARCVACSVQCQLLQEAGNWRLMAGLRLT